jgi:hypothetical protein
MDIAEKHACGEIIIFCVGHVASQNHSTYASQTCLQIFVLVDKAGQTGKGQRLGDQLSMHGESEAIRQWKQRRATGTVTRGRKPGDNMGLDAEIVGLPSESSVGSVTPGSFIVPDVSEGGQRGSEQVLCISLPKRVYTEKRLSALLDALEPSISGVDSRLGLRQMHVAWSSNCTCAQSAVGALGQLCRLQAQAKGRQVRRLEEQIRAFADVVQSGVSSLNGQQLAEAVGAVRGRVGYDNLLKFVASRVLQADLSIKNEAQSLQPSHIATLVEALALVQRDPSVYRKLAGICMQMQPSLFCIEDITMILEGFDQAGVRDKALLRHMANILHSLPVTSYTATSVGSLASTLTAGGAMDDAVYRTLSHATQQLPATVFTPDTLGVVMSAFASVDKRDSRLFRHLSDVAQALNMSEYTAENIARIASAAARAGVSGDNVMFDMLGEAVLALRCSAYTPDTVSRIARAYTECGAKKERVFKYREYRRPCPNILQLT